MMLDQIWLDQISFKLFIQHCSTFGGKKKEKRQDADESLSQEQIKTPRKWDYDKIAEDVTRSTSCTNSNYSTLLP